MLKKMTTCTFKEKYLKECRWCWVTNNSGLGRFWTTTQWKPTSMPKSWNVFIWISHISEYSVLLSHFSPLRDERVADVPVWFTAPMNFLGKYFASVVDGNMSVCVRERKQAGTKFKGQTTMKVVVTELSHTDSHFHSQCICLASVICLHNQLMLTAKRTE